PAGIARALDRADAPDQRALPLRRDGRAAGSQVGFRPCAVLVASAIKSCASTSLDQARRSPRPTLSKRFLSGTRLTMRVPIDDCRWTSTIISTARPDAPAGA